MLDGAKYSTFNHVETKCYIGSKLESTFDDNGNEIKNYAKPEKIFLNVQPVTLSSDIQAFGENASKMKVAVITNRKKYDGKFKEFDCAYLDGASPEGETINGQNANYRIYSVQPQNVVIRIFFIKII